MARKGADRLTNADYYNHLVQRKSMPFDLVYAEIGSETDEPLRLTNAGRFVDLTGNSDEALSGNFIPQSNYLSITPIEEDANFQIGEVSVTLSGVNSAAIALLLSNPYLDRTVKIWRGLFDTEFNVVGEPVLIFDGRISGASVADDPVEGKSTVNVTVSSQWVDFERRNGTKTNDAEQQFRYPGDKGMEFAAAAIRNIAWGRADV